MTETGEIKVESSLFVEDLSYFERMLTPESRIIKLDYILKGCNLVQFTRKVQYPIKPWYQEATAKVVNKLVSMGKIKGFTGAFGIRLPSGVVSLDLSDSVDWGPDVHGLIIVHLFTDETVDYFNSLIPGNFLEPGSADGDAGNWSCVSKFLNKMYI